MSNLRLFNNRQNSHKRPSLRGNDQLSRSNLAGYEIAALPAVARNDDCQTVSNFIRVSAAKRRPSRCD